MKLLITLIMISSTVAFARTGDISYEYEPELQMQKADLFVQRDPSSVDWVKNNKVFKEPNIKHKAQRIEWKKFNKDYSQ